jgi:hypothetical protein
MRTNHQPNNQGYQWKGDEAQCVPTENNPDATQRPEKGILKPTGLPSAGDACLWIDEVLDEDGDEEQEQ